jgi:predicted DNA-binding WGR domain protein
MEQFIVVRTKPPPGAEWALEWVRTGNEANLTVHIFTTEADAARWADRLNALAKNGLASASKPWPNGKR